MKFCVMIFKKPLICIMLFLLFFPGFQLKVQPQIRTDILLNEGWKTTVIDTNNNIYQGFENLSFNDSSWQKVDVPHNWDQYEGYRREKHGNRHGSALYRKIVSIGKKEKNKQYFLWFEGVGSYATIWVNGRLAGCHAGGRTSFTIDITDLVNVSGEKNILAVRADHPAGINDLPWVCGGCSEEWGFSEGSQPMGIFRPVHLIVTNKIRIEPFGVHIWNDTLCNNKPAIVRLKTEIKNYGNKDHRIKLISRLLRADSSFVSASDTIIWIQAGETLNIEQRPIIVQSPRLWSPDDPYLYVMVTDIIEKNRIIDRVFTYCGIRYISWPLSRGDSTGTFLLNGKPVFINGTAEYEHNMGMSHAFTSEQIHARAMQVKAAGFNAFRDAHQPHNLLYQEYWDRYGILWWPQFSAHIWFDNPDFRENFKILLTEWIKERRNSPSVILWGLSNESALPEDFARECTELIRKLDPTCSSQRLVTTCNGGSGTDWNVIQNWSGTYSGDPEKYDSEMKRDLLNGEYGAWRSIDLHTEEGFQNNNVHSENRMCDLMEIKISLAESVRNQCCGHFQWIFSSHENPGRIQNGEGFREIDRIGPVNYKGLLTSWGEPLDLFYLYRAYYAPKETEPMVYIVSHNWPERWTAPGIKSNIVVYSNCDEVELFNGPDTMSLGQGRKNGRGHFSWDSVLINYNLLYARGYVNKKFVAEDQIVLHHLPAYPQKVDYGNDIIDITIPEEGYHYLYRVNCGGPDYKDVYGNLWSADRRKTADTVWGSRSWTDEYEGLPAFYGSQRRTFDPVTGTSDDMLFQTFRYGRNKLRYFFPVPDGEYLVELFFIEPWYGTGGGMNCKGWRIFDVAVNDSVIFNDLDIWNEAGHDNVLKKIAIVKVTGGVLSVSFPQVKSGQAIISAIAVASRSATAKPMPSPLPLINNIVFKNINLKDKWSVNSWLDKGDYQYSDKGVRFRYLPSNLYGAEWIKTSFITEQFESDTVAFFVLSEKADVFVAVDNRIEKLPEWLNSYMFTNTFIENDAYRYKVYARRFEKDDTVYLGPNGKIINDKAEMYTVFAVETTALGRAQDQRSVIVYETEEAVKTGESIKEVRTAEMNYLQIIEAINDSLLWNIKIGVGDTYALKFRYRNISVQDIPVRVKISDMQNNIIYEEEIMFRSAQKWKNQQINKLLNLNAGIYQVCLIFHNKANLEIDALTVQ